MHMRQLRSANLFALNYRRVFSEKITISSLTVPSYADSMIEKALISDDNQLIEAARNLADALAMDTTLAKGDSAQSAQSAQSEESAAAELRAAGWNNPAEIIDTTWFDDKEMNKAISRASKFLKKQLGPKSDPLIIEFKSCSTIEDFTAKVYDVRDQLFSLKFSAKTANEFLAVALNPGGLTGWMLAMDRRIRA